MGDFLQLKVKRRERIDGFLDILKEENQAYKNDPENTGNRLREKLGTWLMESDILVDSPPADYSVHPFNIPDSIMNRICEIAGHVWLEFVEDADDNSIRATGDYPRDRINANIAEFIPETDIDSIFEMFGPEGVGESLWDGGEVLWSKVTNEHLLRLFAPFSLPAGLPAGALPGSVVLHSPAKLRQSSGPWFKRWFRDRMGADVTPTWQVNRPTVVIDLLRQNEPGLRYSFTPENYQDADNCVTWASRALDNLVPGHWLDTVRAQCGIDHPLCGKASAPVAAKPCEDYHIREQGRMKCVTLYAAEADKARAEGLREFL
jgi:hypothetical protein